MGGRLSAKRSHSVSPSKEEILQREMGNPQPQDHISRSEPSEPSHESSYMSSGTSGESRPSDGGSKYSFRFKEFEQIAIATFMSRLCSEELPHEANTLIGCFVSLRLPTLTIQQYMKRLQQYVKPSQSFFVVALVYIDRLIARGSVVMMHKRTIHRVYLVALMLAVKMFEDQTLNNQMYAKIGGVSHMELNVMETLFVVELEFDLNVSYATYCAYVMKIKNYATKISRAKVDQGEGYKVPHANRPLHVIHPEECYHYKHRVVTLTTPDALKGASNPGLLSVTRSSKDQSRSSSRMSSNVSIGSLKPIPESVAQSAQPARPCTEEKGVKGYLKPLRWKRESDQVLSIKESVQRERVISIHRTTQRVMTGYDGL